MSSGYTIPEWLLPYLLGSKKDYSSMQDSIIKINTIFLSLICLTTGSRLLVRLRVRRAAGRDDVLIFIALLFAIFLSTSCLVGERFGLGKHLWNLEANVVDLPGSVARITKILYACYISYSSAISFTKFSIIATYIRIFPQGGYLRKAAYSVGVVVLAFWISSIPAIIFTCVPVQAAWDYTIKDARCFGIVNYFYVAAAFNIATDLVLCLLPMPTFWALSMPRSQRIILCMLFGMGIFACTASILRLTQLHHLSGVDVPYQSVGSLNWSVIEVGTALICASIPALRPLAAKLFPAIFTPSSHPIAVCRYTSNSSQKDPTFEMISPPASNGSGQIYVQKTFDVLELSKLPAAPGMVRIKSNDVYTGRADFYGRSSEEDLVVRR